MAPASFLSKITKFGSFKSIKVFGKSFVVLSSNMNIEKLESILNTIPDNEISSKVNDSIKEKFDGRLEDITNLFLH